MKTLQRLKATLLLSAALCLLWTQSYAQQVTEGNNLIPGAQEWSFMKYGNVASNLFSGTLSLSIPIYTYEDPDFVLPISLAYASNGYMANISAGPVGLGWYLNAGGIISREVKGIDDFEYKKIGDSYYCGYYKTHKFGKPGSGDDLFSMGVKCDSVFMYKHSNTSYSETEPDIFHFNFMGHKGIFRMDEGKINVYATNHPNGEYQINLYNAEYDKGNSIIRITTGDGYIYQFESMQTVGGSYKQYGKNKMIPPFTWYLCKITAPNNRCILFQYNEPEISEKAQVHAYHTYEGMYIISGPNSATSGSDEDGKAEQTIIRQTHRQISKISCEGFTVEFNYSNRIPETYITPDGVKKNLKTLRKLDKISIKQVSDKKTTFSRNCNLIYNFSAGANPVMFLYSVSVEGEKHHSMTYYDMDDLPAQGTTGIDHWGYCNNKGFYDPNLIIPPTNDSDPGYFGYIYRDPNPDKAISGLLKSITYPTGGTKEFIYEPNVCNVSHFYLQDTFYSRDEMVGGLRIKKILSYRNSYSSNYTVEKEYDYHMFCDSNRISSGALIAYPSYRETHRAFSEGFFAGYILKFTSSYNLPSSNSAGFPIVEYEQVKEKYPDGSYKIYYYNNEKTSPQYSAPRNTTIRKGSGTYFEFAADDASDLNRNHDRGQLIKLEQYDKKGTIVQRENFNYNLTRDYDTIRFVKTGVSAFISKCEDVSSSTLQSYVKTSYVNGQESLKDSISYFYNSLGQIVKATTTNSKAQLLTEYTTHIHEKPSLSTDEQYMVNKNMVAAIWRTAKSIKDSNSEKFINAKRHTYKKYIFGSKVLIKPWKTENAIFYSTSSLDDLKYYPEVTYTQYSNNGRLLQSTDRNNVPTTYLWGYDDLYPVAVITNAALTTVSNKLGLTNIENTSNFINGLTDSQEKALRSISNTLTETYNYIPGVGIKTKTDVSGRKTYYNYNTTYKLSNILNEEGTVKSISYSTDAQ